VLGFSDRYPKRYVARRPRRPAEMHEAITRAEFKPENWKQKNTRAARALAVSSRCLISTMYERIIAA
jgi:hypothetical protein